MRYLPCLEHLRLLHYQQERISTQGASFLQRPREECRPIHMCKYLSNYQLSERLLYLFRGSKTYTLVDNCDIGALNEKTAESFRLVVLDQIISCVETILISQQISQHKNKSFNISAYETIEKHMMT